MGHHLRYNFYSIDGEGGRGGGGDGFCRENESEREKVSGSHIHAAGRVYAGKQFLLLCLE